VVALLVGFSVLGSAESLVGLLVVPLVVLCAGLFWAGTAPAGAAGTAGDAHPWATGSIVVGAIVGFAALLVGLLLIGGEASALGLLLPFAVLCGGLLWAVEGAPRPQTAPTAVSTGHVGSGTATSTHPGSVGPTTTYSDPDAPDVPTVLRPQAPQPEGETVSEAVRAEAARTFDLQGFLRDESPDRIQCANCGRYEHLISGGDQAIRCTVCGARRSLGSAQPDTRVRMFLDDLTDEPTIGPSTALKVEQDYPTITTGSSRFAPPSSHRGG